MISEADPRIDVMLLARLASRDQAALEELYDRHSRLLFGLLVRMLANHEDAEEVLQEVFVQAWTRGETYNAQLGSPAAWLIGIARHRAIDRLRSNGSHRRNGEAGTANGPVATPESLASETERHGLVRRALNALPPEQRQLVEFAYFRGATQSELATELNLPLGTVKTRMRAGLLLLRKLLQDGQRT
jgi:RNA polymerase sigma-70 factor, ECF subfamily